jgi:acetyl-CoA carboxylase carboxyl transferase subunit alpha
MNVIVEREKGLLQLEQRIADLRKHSVDQPVDLSNEITALEEKYAQIQREIFGSMSPWQRVNMARHPKRPIGSDYIAALDVFDELHGDRHFRDDAAVIAGFAKLAGRRILVVAQDKGRDFKEKVRRNFGSASPEGYRKVTRLAKLAGHLGLPIVTFVDTSGADPGIGSEERAQSEAIATALTTFADVPVPVVATIIGEGGSGGALALGVANRVHVLEYGTYSVISPEGCASILWKDGAKADEAATRLKITAPDLLRLGVVDRIVDEPAGGAHQDAPAAARLVDAAIWAALRELEELGAAELVADRYQRFRAIGSLLA